MTEFTFVVLYSNGDQLTLSDTLSYDNLPRDGIIGMVVKIQNSELFTLWLEPEQKLIYRHRVRVTPGVADDINDKPDIYFVGWRQKINGKDVQSITYICDWADRGFQIHQAGRFRDDHPWFYSPNLREFEVDVGDSYYDLKDKIFKIKE